MCIHDMDGHMGIVAKILKAVNVSNRLWIHFSSERSRLRLTQVNVGFIIKGKNSTCGSMKTLINEIQEVCK